MTWNKNRIKNVIKSSCSRNINKRSKWVMCPYHCILSAYRGHHTTTDFRKEGWMMDSAYWSVEWYRTRHRGEYTFIHPGRFLFYFIFSRVPTILFLSYFHFLIFFLSEFLLSFLSPTLLLQYLPCKTPEGETKTNFVRHQQIWRVDKSMRVTISFVLQRYWSDLTKSIFRGEIKAVWCALLAHHFLALTFWFRK